MQDLFRPEAVEHHGRRLYGEIILATSLKSWILTALVTTIVAVIGLALAFGSFPRKETVYGQIVPSQGLSKVIVETGSVISAVHVRLGQKVARGDLLLTLQPQNRQQDGADTNLLLLAELQHEEESLLDRLDGVSRQFDTARAMLVIKQADLEHQKNGLARLLDIEKRRITLAKDMIATAEPLLAQGHITKLELQERRQVMLASESTAEKLLLQLSDNTSLLEKILPELAALTIQRDKDQAELKSALATVRQKIIRARAGVASSITAAVDGTVVAVQASPGQRVGDAVALVTILPQNAELQVELYVPSTAAGFLKVGQSVRLLMDAFPFQKYGAIQSEILEISEIAIQGGELRNANSGLSNMFIIRTKLSSVAIESEGDEFWPLRSGMSLSADLILENRATWEVVFAPFLTSLKR